MTISVVNQRVILQGHAAAANMVLRAFDADQIGFIREIDNFKSSAACTLSMSWNSDGSNPFWAGAVDATDLSLPGPVLVNERAPGAGKTLYMTVSAGTLEATLTTSHTKAASVGVN